MLILELVAFQDQVQTPASTGMCHLKKMKESERIFEKVIFDSEKKHFEYDTIIQV